MTHSALLESEAAMSAVHLSSAAIPGSTPAYSNSRMAFGSPFAALISIGVAPSIAALSFVAHWTASSILLAGFHASLCLRHMLVEEEQHQHEGGGAFSGLRLLRHGVAVAGCGWAVAPTGSAGGSVRGQDSGSGGSCRGDFGCGGRSGGGVGCCSCVSSVSSSNTRAACGTSRVSAVLTRGERTKSMVSHSWCHTGYNGIRSLHAIRAI